MSQHVVVSDYNPAWPGMYEKEKVLILPILDDNCIAIYHIGSTSVPGLAAKPIIDIIVVVRSLKAVDERKDAFESIGYEYLGEFGIPGRRYLRKGGDERTHQMHIFQAEDLPNILRHLAFRSYLCTHEKERAAYASLKMKLAADYPYDIESYCDGKDEFVKGLEKVALSFYDDSWDRLFISARCVQREWTLSEFVTAGEVAAALMTDNGNIYTGVCIDTACSLGMCAERNAIGSMITNGEHNIRRLVAVMPDGKAGTPCGSCRELMMQVSEAAGDIEILTDYETGNSVKLSSLIPSWWG